MTLEQVNKRVGRSLRVLIAGNDAVEHIKASLMRWRHNGDRYLNAEVCEAGATRGDKAREAAQSGGSGAGLPIGCQEAR
jgi:hypothetical protein